MTSPTRTDYAGDHPSAFVLSRQTRDQTANRHAKRFTPWLLLCLAVAIATLLRALL